MVGKRSQLTSKVPKVHSLHRPGRLAETHRLANIHPMGSLAQEATSTELLTLHSISSRSCSQPAGLFYKDQPVRKIRHWWLQLLCGSSRVIPWITHALRSQGHSATKIHSLSFVPQLVFLLQASCLIVPGSASRIQRKYHRLPSHWQAQYPWRDLEHASCCLGGSPQCCLQLRCREAWPQLFFYGANFSPSGQLGTSPREVFLSQAALKLAILLP